MPTLVSIQIGSPQHFEADPSLPLSSKPWTTAIFKNPIQGNIAVESHGLQGDGQADLKNHGGCDKAICVYPVEHLPYWQKVLNRTDFAAGAFGENFSVAGLDESSVAIGDRWEIGTAIFEVSQPRQPCWKLARRWQAKSLAAQAIDTGKTGWYLRVIQKGTVGNDAPVTVAPVTVVPVTDTAHPRFFIAQANHLFYRNQADKKTIQELIDVPQLSVAWKSELKKKIRSA